jgi:putative ABC transport system permease protein
VWTTLADWQKLAHIQDAGSAGAATVLAVTFDSTSGTGVDLGAANTAAGTVSTTIDGSFQALGSYKSENGSLLLMQAFLYGISALVIVAFLTVWTVQRTRDIASLAAPFLLTPWTTLLPVAGIVLLGLAGAALAVRSVARVDPLIALGGN